MKLRTVLNDAILKPLVAMEQKVEEATNHDETKDNAVQPTVQDQKPAAQSVPVTPVRGVDDRSAYNCTNCSGEGLMSSGNVCPPCNGTGKV